jgi:hypothetical protein
LRVVTDTHQHLLHLVVTVLPPPVAKLRDEAAAALAQLLPAAAQLAAAREALAAQVEGAGQDVTQHKGRLRHTEEQVGSDAWCMMQHMTGGDTNCLSCVVADTDTLHVP